MPSSGVLGRVVLVRTDVSEELRSSTIKATRNGERGTTLAYSCCPEDGGVIFLINVGSYKYHTA
jgi:hypothetical protein